MSMPSLRDARLRAGRAVLPPYSGLEGTRRRILEAALQLFASRGFHGTSVRDIAKALELQPSALYAHFPSKDQLLVELVRVGHEVHASTLRAALLDAGDHPVERLCALVRAHTVLHATHPHLSVVVNEEMFALDAELASGALAMREEAKALLLGVVEQGAAEGHFSLLDRRATTAALAAMGTRIPYWYEPSDELPIEALAELHVELSLRMLGCSGRGRIAASS